MNTVVNWRPTAPITFLVKRAQFINKLRVFFNKKNFLEVDTPAMSAYASTDPNLSSFSLKFFYSGDLQFKLLYLITSPEFHMKRLLAAGSGPIFQICKSFRNGEKGRYHNPEFTILEWYRPYYNMYDLMNEVDELLRHIFSCNNAKVVTYKKIFEDYCNIDPFVVNKKQLNTLIIEHSLSHAISLNDDIDIILQLLFSILIEPNLGKDYPIFIYHFPASQAGLAKINFHDCRVADRFEVYYKGIELANGFYELINVDEQYQRFLRDNRLRATHDLPNMPLDEKFLASMRYGIPECSGVALGVDRLIMLAVNAKHLDEVIAFPLEEA